MSQHAVPASPDRSSGQVTPDLVHSLTTLNQIAESLNQAVNVRSALQTTLARLVEVMGLQTGWIFLIDPVAQERWAGRGYVLAAHHNLPPALAADNAEAWTDGCDCQGLCNKGRLQAAYNEVRCSRLAGASGDRRGLAVHASSPLRAGERLLGIINVAGPDWTAFNPQTLALLTNVGSQMGIALERARLFDLLQERRIHEQAALLELSNQLLGRLELDDVIQYLVQSIPEFLSVDACALLLPAEPGTLAFRAVSGWRYDPVAAGQRVPADERSGSGRAMRFQQPVEIEDIQQYDPTPWTTGWLRAEGFRGHTVVPLVAEGRSIGSLVVDRRQPGLLSQDELRFLRLLANQAAIAIVTARLHEEEVERQRLEKELAVARDIQLNLLPESCPEVPGWEFAAVYQAASMVGGDFYDFFELPGEPNRQLGLVIADVAGKGVPAALLMALSRTIIRTVALSGRSPAATLERANELILKDSLSTRFVSAFYATLNTRNGRLVFASAGHNQPLWWQAATGRCDPLPARGAVLGIFETMQWTEEEVELAPGDLLVFYTDGITEAMNAAGHMFGEGRLRVIAANPEAGALQTLGAIVKAYNDFIGQTPQSDDFTLVVVKRLAT